MISLKVNVDLSNIKNLPVMQHAYFIDFQEINLKNYEYKIDLNTDEANERAFLTKISQILTSDLSKIKLRLINEQLLELQTNQVLFVYYLIKRKPFYNKYHLDQRKDNVHFFERYEPLYNGLTNEEGTIDEFIIKIKGKTTTKEYKLPKLENITHFRDAFLEFLNIYYGQNPTCRFINRLGLPLEKNLIEKWHKYNAFLMREGKQHLQQFSETTLNRADAAKKLIELLNTFPQFAPKPNTDKPLISNVHAKFILRFFYLLGFSSRENKINFTNYTPDKADIDHLRSDLLALKTFHKRNTSHKYF